MYVDINFGTPTVTNSNTPTISTNVYDAGAAILLFGGPKHGKIFYSFDVSVDCSGAELRMVGASAAALNANVEVIGSTGRLTTDKFGAALATGTQRVEGWFPVHDQKLAKQYYGLFLELAGTNPDATAGKAVLVWDAATNMLKAQDAVPGT